jgi:preprotein translocase subunit SecA
LVEYRRQGQYMFEEMQTTLRHDVVRSLFHAQPVSSDDLEQPTETELTRAARQSVDNADRVINAAEFKETDFKPVVQEVKEHKNKSDKRKKARKAERQRRTKSKGKRHK